MIDLVGVSKSYRRGDAFVNVLDNATLSFKKGGRVAVLGENGAGKSTLLKLLAGSIRPDTGQICRNGSVSWPVGFGGNLHPEMSGYQNINFVARIYGARPHILKTFVHANTSLGNALNSKVKTYSSGMRAQLAFTLSMAFEFDYYLIDEVLSVGDAVYREHAVALLSHRLSRSGALIVSHSFPQLIQLCDSALLIRRGSLTFFQDVEEAIQNFLLEEIDRSRIPNGGAVSSRGLPHCERH